MYNILTQNKIANVGLAHFDSTKYKIYDQCDKPDAILVRSKDLHDYALPDTLLAIARAGAGVNNIPIPRCSQNGVVVFNTPGANANAVKELVIAMLLLSSRNIIAAHEWAQNLAGQDGIPALVEKGKSAFAGCEVMGKRLGVIGLGAVGAGVAGAAQALGMEVVGIDPYISVEGAWRLPNTIRRASSNREIFESCDYITLHAPLNNETTDTIDSAAVACMKPGVRIINTSRAGLVNSAALLHGIDTGRIACYVTDFPDADMLGKPNVIPIPHLGASTEESEDNCAVMACDQIIDYIENGNIKNSVNFPTAVMELQNNARLCITHANVPQILGRINMTIGSVNINIEDQLNRSRGDIGYTIIDTNADISPDTLRTIEQIDGVIRVRVIKRK